MGRDFQELGFQKTLPSRQQSCPLVGELPRNSQASTGERERGYCLVSIISPELCSPDKLIALPWATALYRYTHLVQTATGLYEASYTHRCRASCPTCSGYLQGVAEPGYELDHMIPTSRVKSPVIMRDKWIGGSSLGSSVSTNSFLSRVAPPPQFGGECTQLCLSPLGQRLLKQLTNECH